MSSTKRRLIIVTTDFKHPTYHRIHFFLPLLRQKFNVTIINIEKIYLVNKNKSPCKIRQFVTFLVTATKIMLGRLKPANDVYTIEIPKIQGALLFSLLIVPILIRKILKKSKNTAIWGMAPVAGYSVLLSKVSIPFVYDDNDRHYLFYSNPLIKRTMRFLERNCILRSSIVTSAGPSLFASAKKIRNSGHTVFLPNAISLSKPSGFPTIPKLFDLVYVGIVDEWCGLHTVLEAFGRSISIIPNSSFLVVGPVKPSYFEKLQEIMHKYNLSSQVKFIGRVSHDEVLICLKQSKIGVAVYQNNDLMKFAFTIKLLEYMAAELAVLASDVGDTGRIVQKAKCGIIVDNDIKKISESIIQLLNDPNYRHELGKNGRRFVEENFEIEIIAAKLNKLFDDLDNAH